MTKKKKKKKKKKELNYGHLLLFCALFSSLLFAVLMLTPDEIIVGFI
jgi:membrane protease YdiL (CAAX protease family)